VIKHTDDVVGVTNLKSECLNGKMRLHVHRIQSFVQS